ncbi:MAG: type III pantothenate kinase [Firmicutes bacterium]|nr:type III pantothenate kinase [Bacillota bacterium]
MLVAIDIGNTNITIGLFDGDDLLKQNYRITTKVRRTSDEYGLMLQQFLMFANVTRDEIDDVIISSVVPKVMHSFKNGVMKVFGIEPILLNPNLNTGINITLENPRSTGLDRIADCAGAYYHHGGNILVIDFGTATTYNYVDKDGNFSSGLISVGIETAASALASNTSQLPEIAIKKPEKIMATNTHEEMEAGIFYLYVGGVDYIISEYKKVAGDDMKVITTGGLGRVLCEHVKQIDVYDPGLIFKGLKVIYDYNK